MKEKDEIKKDMRKIGGKSKIKKRKRKEKKRTNVRIKKIGRK